MSTRPNDIAVNAKISTDILKKWYDTFNDMTSMQIIEVEYMGTSTNSTEWKLMYSNRNNFAGGKLCTICDTVLMNTSHIMEHNNGKKHRANVEIKVKKFRHPFINPEKLIPHINPFTPNDDKIKKLREQLKNEMTTMNLNDMELIEYKFTNMKWNKLLSRNDVGYICNMCNSYTLINLKIIRNHLQTAKHKNNLNIIHGLYHPKISPIKDLMDSPDRINDDEQVKIVKSPSNLNNCSMNNSKTKELIEKHAEINIDLLLHIEIQCKPNDKYEKLISKPNNTNHCTCTVCKINIVGISELRKHLRLSSHVKNIQNMNGIYHPILAPFKNTVDATAENVDLSVKEEYSIKTPNTVKTNDPTTKENSEAITTADNVVNNNHGPMKNNVNPITKDHSESVAPTNIICKNEYMSDKEFRTIICTLDPIELAAVEFYKNNHWRKLIVLVNRSYNCIICNVKKISNFNCLIDHLKGKRHLLNIKTISRFYHPTKTIPKSDILDKNLPTTSTSLDPKEQQLFKTPNKNNTGNLNNIDEDIKILPVEIITVEDSPERYIKPKKESSETDTEFKEKNNNDGIIKSINTKLPDTNLNSDSNVNKKKTRVIINDAKAIDDINRITGEESSNDDDVIFNTDTDNIVVNPAAVIKSKINGPQYQQNRIILPRRYKSGVNLTLDSSKIPIKSLKTADDTPNFSTKSFTPYINNNIEGLIGVEYVVKIIQHAADDSPRFECCLCEIELGGIAMQNHLRNLKHRLKYLDRHFQTCIKQYKDHRKDGIIMTEIVDRIAKAIEKYHGRDLPYECVQSDYRRNRQDIMEKVFSFRHVSDLSGPSFTNIVDANALDDIVRNKHKLGDRIPEVDKRKTTFDKENTQNAKRQRFHSPKRILTFSNKYTYINNDQQNVTQPPQAQFGHTPQIYQEFNNQMHIQMNPSLDDAEHRRLSENFIKNTKIRESHSAPLHSPQLKRRISPRRHMDRSSEIWCERSRSSSHGRHNRDHSRTPSRSPLRENDVWQAYRRKFDMDIKILDFDYEGYNKDPQSYPLYNEEWQNFWAKRMNELKTEKKDHQSYDFTSEWASYFPRRLKKLYEKNVEELKVRLRERFVLPMHNRELRNERYFLKGNYEDNYADIEEPPLPPIIRTNYLNYTDRGKRSRSKSRSISRSRSNSSNKNYKIKMKQEILNCEILSSDDNNEDPIVHKKKNKNNDNDNDDYDRIDFGPLTVVSVLRFLTALEDSLGSLGPRVVDLLSKALTLEKIKPNHSDEILLTPENCIFLETCSEKLKIQVLAGEITKTRLRAVRQAIKDIFNLVTKTNDERAKKPVLKPPILRKPQIVQKFGTSSTQKIQTSSTQKIQTSSNSTAVKGNTNNQICSNKQLVTQPQHPTVMSQEQKKDLASNLAAALAAQGKTDISTENCERLIEIYAMIDKKRSETENRGGDVDNRSLSDTLTNILSTGNLSALSTLFQSNRQQNATSTTTASEDNYSRNQLYQNQSFNQGYQNLANNNFGFNSTQNQYSNNFNQLANFDTSLNLTSIMDVNRQQLNNSHYQANRNTSGIGQPLQIWENPLQQGNNQNWISGNNVAHQLFRDDPNSNQFNIANNQSNSMLQINQNRNSTNLLSQTLLNSSQLRNNLNNLRTPINNSSITRIDTGAQNSPAYATGASYKANAKNNNNDSYPNLWHRQNREQQSISGNTGGGINENLTMRFPNREQLMNQQYNLLGNRFTSNIDGRNVSNSGQNTIENLRSDFTGRR